MTSMHADSGVAPSPRGRTNRSSRRGKTMGAQGQVTARYPVGKVRSRLLTAADEIALAARVQAGDRAARNELVLHNLGLVPFIARPYQRLGPPRGGPGRGRVPRPDRRSRAVRSRGHPGCRFSTLCELLDQDAFSRMDSQASSSSVTRNTWTGPGITTGTRARRSWRNTWPGSRMPSGPRCISRFGTRCDEAEVGDSRADIPIDPHTRPPDEELERAETRRSIELALDCLTPLERQVIVRLYGLCDCPVQNAREIGDLLGFTREYVRQLKGRALAKLQQALATLRRLRMTICR